MSAIVWLRRDLRLHDHPALAAALASHERVAAVFCLDRGLLQGRHRSGPRTQFPARVPERSRRAAARAWQPADRAPRAFRARALPARGRAPCALRARQRGRRALCACGAMPASRAGRRGCGAAVASGPVNRAGARRDPHQGGRAVHGLYALLPGVASGAAPRADRMPVRACPAAGAPATQPAASARRARPLSGGGPSGARRRAGRTRAARTVPVGRRRLRRAPGHAGRRGHIGALPLSALRLRLAARGRARPAGWTGA
jgi:hypothetical protein